MRHQPLSQHRFSSLPDVAADAAVNAPGSLDRVGMSRVELPIRLKRLTGEDILVPARATVMVNLADPHAKGIHMSRLYLQAQRELAGIHHALGDGEDSVLQDRIAHLHATIRTNYWIDLPVRPLAGRAVHRVPYRVVV